MRESRLAASIDHQGVIPIYEAGEAGGQLFIAMRHVDGIDLGELLRREGALDAARALALVAQLAAALDAAHSLGLVHRDVKPSNALVAKQGDAEHVYLSDFGLSKDLAGDATLSASGGFGGTVRYMAPEVIRSGQRGRPLGPVLARLPAVRVSHRRGALPRAVGRRGPLRPPRGTPAARERQAPRAAAGARRGARTRTGQGP